MNDSPFNFESSTCLIIRHLCSIGARWVPDEVPDEVLDECSMSAHFVRCRHRKTSLVCSMSARWCSTIEHATLSTIEHRMPDGAGFKVIFGSTPRGPA